MDPDGPVASLGPSRITGIYDTSATLASQVDARLVPVDPYGAPRTPFEGQMGPTGGPWWAQAGPLEGPWKDLGGPLKGPWDPHPGPYGSWLSQFGPTPCPSLDPHRVQAWTQTMSKFGPTPGPSLDPHRVQVWTHTVSKARPASISGPRHCLISWSQVLLHFLVPGTASFSGPKSCFMQGPRVQK